VHIAYVSEKDLVCSASGAHEVHAVIRSKLSKDKTFIGIQDDYHYWHDCGEACDAGKLLLIDEDTDEQPECRDIHIFFDDNIERDRAHIVDVRDLGSFTSLPFHTTQGKWLLKVEPFLAIHNERYFINLFDKILSDHYGYDGLSS